MSLIKEIYDFGILSDLPRIYFVFLLFVISFFFFFFFFLNLCWIDHVFDAVPIPLSAWKICKSLRIQFGRTE